MKIPPDQFWWSLFGAGGVVSALFMPVVLLLTAIVIPLGWVDAPRYEDMLTLSQHPLTRLFLFALVALSLFHWAHRFRFTLYDGLQLKHLEALIVVFCYGGALVGTVTAAVLLWQL